MLSTLLFFWWETTGAALSAWPATLPSEPEGPGYVEQPPNGLLQTNMDAGLPERRRRFTAAAAPLMLTWIMTDAQVQIVDNFYLAPLLGGSLPFIMNHPRTGDPATFRFTAQPFYAWLGPDVWRVTTPLEVMP